MTAVKCEDLLKYRFVSGLEMSPDGHHAFFIETHIEGEDYVNELKLLDTKSNEVKYLTSRVGNVFWKDDEHIVFSGKIDIGKNEEKGKDYFVIDITGGEAEYAFSTPFKGNLTLMEDGTYLVNEVVDLNIQEPGENEAVLGKDYEILDEVPFWFNGRGFINKKRSALFLYDGNEKKQLSDEYCSVDSVAHNERYIAFSGIIFGDKDDNCLFDEKNSLYLYDRKSGKKEEIFDAHCVNYSHLCFMDETHLYMETLPFSRVGMNPRSFILDVESRELEELEFLDVTTHSAVGSDCTYGGTKGQRFFNGELYQLQTVWSHSRLVKLNRDHEWMTINDNDGAINGFDVNEDGIFFIGSRDGMASIYRTDRTDGVKSHGIDTYHDKELEVQETCIYSPNTVSYNVPEYFTYTSKSGIEMEGYVIRPVPTGLKQPAVFEIHGGPKVVYGKVFHHEMQMLAGMGYYVFYTNPRGADGRGEEFADLTGRMGTVDYDDLMEFVDEVVKRYPGIDEKKIGICGGSYGGFMCNWMIGHTDRFAAAASQRSISNYFSKSLICDNGYCDNMAQMDTTPWEDPMQMWDHSPLKYAPQAKTPTLFIQSDEDYRCHMSDAISMFTSLMNHGVETKMVLFHHECHDLSRSGKPSNRIKRLKEIAGWFDKYLK